VTSLQALLVKMAAHPKYGEILDTPGFACDFNEFVNAALGIEKLVLDHWAYKDRQAAARAKKRASRKGVQP